MDLALYNSNYFIKGNEVFTFSSDPLITIWTPSTGAPENNRGIIYPIDPLVCVRYKQEEFTKDFIRHFKGFLTQWEEQSHFFKGIDVFLVTNAIKEVLELIIPLEPSFFSFELTEDRSIFFKVGINNYNIYLELYFAPETSEFEAIMNIYKDKVNIYAFGGEIFECVEKIKKVALVNSTYLCENELSDSFASR